jgi:hypothetical protein
MKKILSYSIVSTIFIDFTLFNNPFDFYLYYIIYLIFLVVYLFNYAELKFNFPFLKIILSFFFFSIVAVLMNNYSLFPVIKQLLIMLFSSLTFFLLIKLNNYDLEKIFKIYLNCSFLVALLGLIQYILYLLGVDWHYQYKITSLLSEPADLCIVISPALFVAISQLISKDKKYLSSFGVFCIIIAYLLTLSVVGILGILISAFLLLIKGGISRVRTGTLKSFTIILLVLLMSLPFVYHIPSIKLRIDDTIQVIKGERKINPDDINLSTFALYSNSLIAYKSFLQSPIFGTGLGTHEINYDRFIDDIFPIASYNKSLKLNRMDGSSLFVRLLSETGIMGLSFFLIFIWKHRICYSASPKGKSIWLMNNAVLVSILLRLLRFGNYSGLGFFYFIFIYYYSKKSYTTEFENVEKWQKK